MFQYAFARLLQEKYNVNNVFLDTSYFDNSFAERYLKNGIELLNVNYQVADKNLLHKHFFLYNDFTPHHFMHRSVAGIQAILNPAYYFEKDRDYRKVENIINHIYFDGYWQSWRYLDPIDNILREEFKPRNSLAEQTLSFIKKYSAKKAVFIGIRRGDYASSSVSCKHYGVTSIEYYKQAITQIVKRIHNAFFVIFSDDIEWVHSQINFNEFGISKEQIEHRDRDKIVSDFEEMYVMASCKHAIISNSTFNFWGAWLIDNPKKIVIAPKDWFKDGSPIDIVPPTWLKI